MAKNRPRDGTDPGLARFGRNVRRARQRAGLSQETLAILAQISQGEISVIEGGRREPGVLSLVALARALHVDPCDLLKGVN